MELVRCTDEIAHLARHDPLTGLPNRRRLRELADAIRADGRSGAVLLFLDLDGFKVVNDRHGHAVGDELLRIVAERLRASVPETEVVARLGGDEFAVLLRGRGFGTRRAAVLADELIVAIGQPYWIGSDRIEVGVSIRMAAARDSLNLDKLLAMADGAVYAAKARGRGRCQAA